MRTGAAAAGKEAGKGEIWYCIVAANGVANAGYGMKAGGMGGEGVDKVDEEEEEEGG